MPLFWRHSKLDPDGQRDIPPGEQQLLLRYLDVEDQAAWEQQWRSSQLFESTLNLWPASASPDWLWSLGLPLLTEAARDRSQRRLIGLSALPGCGKTTLGHWLEQAALQLDLPLQVVSIDDFYYEAERLEQAMRGNPWAVPRALPGSHDVPLLHQSLCRWKRGETVDLPQFDKSLRQGRGDRSGWRSCSAEILVLEGWFVGCQPLAQNVSIEHGCEHLSPPIRSEELKARVHVQDALRRYQSVWAELDTLWQIKAQDIRSPQIWKRQQENQMLREQGVALDNATLLGFIRMILAAIPPRSFDQIDADVCVEVDPDRRLRQLRINERTQDSPSSVSRTG